MKPISKYSAFLASNSAQTTAKTIKRFLAQFKHKFDIDSKYIDLREMAKNYPSEIIPLEDIYHGIVASVGERIDLNPTPYTPGEGGIPSVNGEPGFAYVQWDELYLWTLFQRDVAPNHFMKIYKDFDRTSVIVPCAIKITVAGKAIFCLWDGHHTAQVCHSQGYQTYPLWYVDIDLVPDEEIARCGFDPLSERVQYGIWHAGQNMIRINSKNKRPLAAYDEFLIRLETRDADAVAMDKILKKNKCKAARQSKRAGHWTQIKSGIECYELADNYGRKGRYWDRALAFHRNTWTQAPLELEIFRPMSYLYSLCDTQNCLPDKQFDIELARLLTTKYGSPESAQLKIKESYEKAVYANQTNGAYLTVHKEIVLAGLINLYNQHVGRVILPLPSVYWKM